MQNELNKAFNFMEELLQIQNSQKIPTQGKVFEQTVSVFKIGFEF